MSTGKGRLSVDDFLACQTDYKLLATIEPVKDNPDIVNLTPWLPSKGCFCQYALSIPKESIEYLSPTDDRHVCCGKVLRVAIVQFKEGATIELNQLFEQVVRSASSSNASDMPIATQLSYLNEGRASGSLGPRNALRSSALWGQPDVDCVLACIDEAYHCLRHCRYSTFGWHCRQFCFEMQQHCIDYCYPLFPKDILSNL